MTKKRFIRNILIIIIKINILSNFLWAEPPYEKFHVPYGTELRAVLIETIGILTITHTGEKKGNELNVYIQNDEQFIKDKVLKIKEMTLPISNCGYHTQDPSFDELISHYRYPIVGINEKYLQIVYDPIKHLKAWINIEELEDKFETFTVMLNSINKSIMGKSIFGPDYDYNIDIFYFTTNGKRKLYEQPNEKSKFTIIAKKERRYNVLKIIQEKNEFLKIGIVHMDYKNPKTSIEPIGWIKIRDNQGMLMFWIILIDQI